VTVAKSNYRFAVVRRIGVALSVAVLLSVIAHAEDFPNHPLRLVASEAGGGGDFAARLIAQNLAPMLGQPVVVENRGGGVIAGDLVARAPADGHTLLLYGNTFWLLPLMRKSMPYDPLRDFVPVSLAARATNILVVHPALPVRSVAQLVSLAKAKPGARNYGSAAPGTSNHLAAELFKWMARVEIERIAYRGTASILNALMAGQVQLMFSTSASVAPQVRAGRLRALAVTSLERSTLFPELPTMAASGLPGFESVSLHGVFAPAKTSPVIVNRLNDAIVQVLNQSEVRERFQASGVETLAGPPGALAAAMDAEIARMGKVIRSAGIRDD
jgi:tripartite-type tricarboxylate transporter receptor subunit TctC